ncbi:MAG: helix-turn-helix transcriptional regulator [Leptolyngbya sp. IPPAS B-1204]|uniref:LuxR family transcriptional regulator n=1 Tax=Leptolyngbya sp. NK1-12 TaxID=2547451 RepID=A0AA96WB38_9CYAN|nr:LuxR family transcriptional regulator [Elainella sp. C42_A2020_010]RNJ65109.1 MAG: LuxR family transcriptional regulator [Leptolyngbya sp. IPPAS B-1204]WNZ21640.1 LuxR family transcriptional regulator [Leptolyngbya sp. NK1-12]
MEISLQTLFEAIAQAQDEAELRQSVMKKVGEYFVATRWGLSFLSEFPSIDDNTPGMIKLALSLDHNPILRYLMERHAPVHEEVLLPPGVWQTICPRADHGHVMIGPIVFNALLVGGIAFTRHRDCSAFNQQNLLDLSAVCLHLSTRLATLRLQPIVALPTLNDARLTPREAQIAELVAQGLTGAEIGAALWITENTVKQALKRMFRKLKVSSRAEMIAKLSRSRPSRLS